MHSGVVYSGISDHCLVYAIRKIRVFQNAEDPVEIRNMKNFNEKFVNALLTQHKEYIYYFGENSNTMWEIWKELFLEVLHKHAPLQHKKTRSSKVSWITNKIKGLISTGDKLKRKAIITKLKTDWLNYKKI